jgi:broad specificity phosphatase PhoE
MILIFETHAESVDNAEGVASGWHDVDLSARGDMQARALGERRRDGALDAVYCSDSTRAWRTAELAFGGRRVPIVRDARLRECDYGELTRAPAAAVEHARRQHVLEPFPGGESYTQVVDRVRDWLADAVARHVGGTVLVIGHRATFFALEHLVHGGALAAIVDAPWAWQPGWKYDLPDRFGG